MIGVLSNYKPVVLIVLLLCLFPLLTTCGKSDVIKDEEALESVQVAYDQAQSIIRNSNVSEAFLFFTDPHLLSGDNQFSQTTKNNLNDSFKSAKDLYDKLMLDFCLCGGDWLNDGDTQDLAKEKLLYADQLMKTTFSKYYKIMGNHDTNYLGFVSKDKDKRGDLPRSFIDGEYFSETGSAYYSFDGRETRFFILDSGLDWEISMDEYRLEQILWLAEQLRTNDREHIVIGIHMFYSEDKITPMSEILVKLCDAFNEKKEISIGDREIDFTLAKGRIHMILSGHNHKDGLTYEGISRSLPVVRTCNYTINGTQTFDLCFVDYNKEVLNLVRVGRGDNRVILFNNH